MLENEPNYEAMPVWEQLKLLQAWAPLIAYGQRLLATDDPYAKAVIVGDALEWLASKSQTTFDDGLAARVVAIVKTKEGEELVRWLVARAGGKA